MQCEADKRISNTVLYDLSSLANAQRITHSVLTPTVTVDSERTATHTVERRLLQFGHRNLVQ